MNTPSPEKRYSTSFEVGVVVTINEPDVIERITNPVRGEEWRTSFYQLYTADDVIKHLAYNCAANGVERVNRLEGWADLADDAATMGVEGIEELGEVIAEEQFHA